MHFDVTIEEIVDTSVYMLVTTPDYPAFADEHFNVDYSHHSGVNVFDEGGRDVSEFANSGAFGVALVDALEKALWRFKDCGGMESETLRDLPQFSFSV